MLDTPTVSRIGTDDPTVYAFEIRPNTQSGDLEAMAAVMNEAFNCDEPCCMLLRLTEIEMADALAALNLESLKAQMRSAAHLDKYAVVGAPGPAEAMIKLMVPLIPITAKTFAPEEEEKAWAFVGATPV